MRNKKPVIYADDLFKKHDTGMHPECAARLDAVYSHLDRQKLWDRFHRGTIRPATREEITTVHDGDYMESIATVAGQGGGRVDPDTVVSPDSNDVALRAAGCAVSAVDDVITGGHPAAVCLTRPPGHHARPSTAMGFCLFNNVAVAAKHACRVHELDRVFVVDWDVHHGNGTQEMFYEDEQVYFFSVHRSPFYPGTGAKDETGTGKGLGTIFNLPLAFGIERREYLRRVQLELQAAASKCKPQLVLVSAGFDAHRDDPIGSLGLESDDFTELTSFVQGIANEYCDGRLVSLLEGGYNVDALAESVELHLRALLDPDTDRGTPE